MNLTGQQRKRLQNALIDAFPTKASLEQMLSFELDKNLDEIAGGKDLQNIVFNLIKRAEAESWVEDLIVDARNSNEGNLKLKNLAEELLSNNCRQLIQLNSNDSTIETRIIYIKRPPIEEKCYKAILQPGSLIRIKAPQRMGKTLLLEKLLDYARSWLIILS
jgi:Effector-associated domain 1/AAA-like domain